MKNKYIRMKSMLLAIVIALTGQSLTSCVAKNYNGNELECPETLENYEKKEFNVGEHIISVPIKNPTQEIKQYNYHEGYKVIGIATANYEYEFGGACLIYANEYPVVCYSTSIDKNGNHIYGRFGQPIGYYKDETIKTPTTKEFHAGEHIISVPIDNPTQETNQYEYHEGYEVVGIATANYEYEFGGACILYVNTKNVTCTLTKTEDNVELYLDFGAPTEKTNSKKLK